MALKQSLAILLAASLSVAVAAQTPVEWAEKAMQAEKAGRIAEAESAWQQAVQGLEKSGDKPNLARAYLFRGLFFFDQKRRAEARSSLLQARELFVATSDDKGLALVETQLGEVERILGNLPQAEAHLRLAVSVAERAGDTARKFEALGMLGRLLDAAQRWPEATAIYNDIAKHQRETGSPQLGNTLVTLAALHQMQDLNRQALAFYAEAAGLLKTPDPLARAAALQLRLERFGEAVALYDQLLIQVPGDPVYQANRAYALERLGRDAEALQAYERWLADHPAHRQAGDVREQRLLLLYRLERHAEALAGLPAEPSARARLLQKFGRHEEAISTLSDALAAAEGRTLVRLANQLGVLQLSRHQVEAARNSFSRGLEVAPDDSVLLGNLGETYLAAGESDKAIPWMQRALTQMKKQAAAPEEIATTLNNIAAAQQRLGNWEESLATLREAEQVAQSFAGPHALRGKLLNLTGYGYAKLGRTSEALSYYRQALAVRRSQGDKRGEVVTLLNMGAVLAESKALKHEARPYFEQAAQVNREVKDAELGITIENNLASLEPTAEAARERYLRALAGAGENALLRGTILASLSRTEAGSRAQRQAEADEAFGLLQSLGAREQLFVLLPFYADHNLPLPGGGVFHLSMLELLGDLLRGLPARSAGAFIESHRGDLERATESAWRSGSARDLLECEERIRALAVLAMTRDVNLQYEGLPPELVQRSKSLQSRLEDLLGRPPSRQVNEDVRRLKLEFGLVSDEMERVHLSSGILQQARPSAPEELQRSLHPDEALVEYVQLPDRWLAVVVQPSGLQVVELGPREPLNQSIAAAGEALERVDELPQVQAALSRVSESIWLPVARTLPAGVRRVVLIPTGPLYGVPMAALPFEGQPLIGKFQVESGSSATAWLLSRRSQSRGKGAFAAALGNFQPTWAARGLPDGLRSGALAPLPGTLREVQQLARLLPGTRVVSEKAMTVQQLQSNCRGAGVVHFATHGILDADQPLLGGLVAADQMVRVADVFNWKLDAELAVLSACNTGKLKGGEEWVGLTRAFQHAGARSLLASLWAVSDTATAEWMSHFYAGLRSGRPISAAVQEACLKTRARYPHPSHWAAFVLWGDGAQGLQ
jgi:CHAT domain-containing protein/tetratricopeptide (TPR) repeat protein